MPPKPPHDAAAPLSARMRCGVHSCPSRRGLGSDGLGRCRPSRGWGGEVPYAVYACGPSGALACVCYMPGTGGACCRLGVAGPRGHSQSGAGAGIADTGRAALHSARDTPWSAALGRAAASGTGGGSAPRPLKGDWRAPAPCPAWHHSGGRPCLVQLHILGRVPGPDGMLDDRSALTRVHVHKSELHRLRQHESPFCPALGRLVANPHPSKAAITPPVRCILCRLIADETAGHPRTD
jgi:hypothetical protein